MITKGAVMDCKIIDLEGYRAERASRSSYCCLDSINEIRIRIPKDLNDWLKCGEVVMIQFGSNAAPNETP